MAVVGLMIGRVTVVVVWGTVGTGHVVGSVLGLVVVVMVLIGNRLVVVVVRLRRVVVVVWRVVITGLRVVVVVLLVVVVVILVVVVVFLAVVVDSCVVDTDFWVVVVATSVSEFSAEVVFLVGSVICSAFNNALYVCLSILPLALSPLSIWKLATAICVDSS